ncbi:DUF1616 domain-containing protein [Halobaculum limi]|uniref:DUF1616 domain-containing protein n=1 Tax=Halobaculum limi TaxID=3031916 RepID=UPI002404989D|nr:DUF1616 domain-containing protein [Halobaculum sp. YSMS11]
MAVAEDDERPVPHADLLAVVVGVALALSVVFTPLGEWRPLALVIGLPFVLLIPGYALVSVVFPRAGETGLGEGKGWLSRLVLSIAGSVMAIAVVGVALEFTVWGFRREAVVGMLAAWTLAASAVAWYRRRQVRLEARAGASVSAVRDRAYDAVAGDGPVGVFLTLLVVAVAIGGVAVVVADTTSSGTATEFYILGENESGELVAGSYPMNLTVGERATVGIGVSTTRPTGFNGSVVASLERVSVDGESVTITESRRLESFGVSVSSGETTIRRHTFQPQMTGERLRLTYRLYERGSESAFRSVHIWISVSPPE